MTLRCLVVDNDAFSRTTVAAALNGQHFDVVATVGTVPEAMAVDATSIDVAVLDLDFRVVDPNGVDLAHALRRVSPNIGIVLLTTFSDPRLFAASIKELPASSTYVVKQSLVDIRILTTALRRVIRIFSLKQPSNYREFLSPTRKLRHCVWLPTGSQILRLLGFAWSRRRLWRLHKAGSQSTQH